MNIVFLTHPSFLGSQSMPRFANMLADGMRKRNHHVELWTAQPKTYNLSAPASAKKWLGYIDQYLLFPADIKKKLKKCPADTLFIFTDHALGPWVPLLNDRPHVIHCHDFLAQRSALGEIAENPTGLSGKIYQSFIRRGYRKGKNFISVSKKTQTDLHRFLTAKPLKSEVVYNGLNQSFKPADPLEARKLLSDRTGINLEQGYFLHVGGNQWYKNRLGVIDIYNSWRSMSTENIPLLLIGANPNDTLKARKALSPYKKDIYLLTGIEDKFIPIAYSGATIFIFPSLAEGFGWPIAEAMASGVPVITTNETPMTEVSGDAAFLIPRMPNDTNSISQWSLKVAETIEKVIKLSDIERKQVITQGLTNAKRFDASQSLDKIEEVYINVLNA